MKKLLLMILAFLPAMLFADSVTEERAQAIAERFFATSRPAMYATSTMQSPSLRMIWNGESTVTRAADAPAFYVFNNENGKGFVIVSGDECTTSPILGYSFEENFSATEMPSNLSNWMNGIRGEILEGRAMQTRSQASVDNWLRFEYNDKTPIVKLETALWDQRAPYNSALPIGYVTGCPATAIAIIMRYHQWPDKGVGTIPESNDKVGEVKLGHTYDWKNMPLTYNDMPTEAQKKEVGILMRDVGAMVRTQYGAGTAGANPEETLPQLMPIYMRYNAKTIKSYFKRDFKDAEWHTMMQKELDEKRPVLYGGYSSGGGHQFVLDGYAADNYYHVNWGWSGVSNGYYLLTGMNPPEQGAGGSSSADGFTNKQDAIIGIQPDATNPGGGHFDQISYKGWPNKPYGMSVTDNDFKQNKEFSVIIKEIQNKGSRDFKGKVAIGHFAENGSLKGIISKKEISYVDYPIAINDITESNMKCVITSTIEKGDYICGVFKYENPSEWTMIRNGYTEREDCTEKIMLANDGGGDTPEPPVQKLQLTVKVGDGGALEYNGKRYTGTTKIDADPDQTFRFELRPDANYKLMKILFNGNDYTAFGRDGHYTTPKISKSSTLEVQFDYTGAKYNVNVTVGENGKVAYGGAGITGTMSFEVIEKKTITLDITPDKGYQAKVTNNDVDVTKDVKDGKYTTPAITSDTNIKVDFTEVTGITEAGSEKARVYAADGELIVEGAEGTVSVYTMDGVRVAAVAAAPALKIALKSNVYIVRIGNKSYKVVL